MFRCHINNITNKFECDKCIEGYILNEKSKKCESISCDEYPEITPGCIVCNDRIDKYKSKNANFVVMDFLKLKMILVSFVKQKILEALLVTFVNIKKMKMEMN